MKVTRHEFLRAGGSAVLGAMVRPFSLAAAGEGRFYVAFIHDHHHLHRDVYGRRHGHRDRDPQPRQLIRTNPPLSRS
jgi:hypothetical protein